MADNHVIHTSVNVTAVYVHIIRGSEGLVRYLHALLKGEGHITSVKKNIDSSTTSIFVGTAWEVVIADTKTTPLRSGDSTPPRYAIFYHSATKRDIHVGTVNDITVVIAVVSSTAMFD